MVYLAKCIKKTSLLIRKCIYEEYNARYRYGKLESLSMVQRIIDTGHSIKIVNFELMKIVTLSRKFDTYEIIWMEKYFNNLLNQKHVHLSFS